MKYITDSVLFTGVFNPNMRVADVIMHTEYGTSYNSYVVKGSDKVAMIEAAHLSFSCNYLDNIAEALDGRDVDYLVLNHCEPDHSGCVAHLLDVYPNLTIVVSQAGSLYIKNITNRTDLNIQVVKDGDSISLGDKTLQFINAPFLHWPDSMFTWLPEEKMLFSCDFLGAHFCEPQIYDHRMVYEKQYWKAMAYYFDCIFRPFLPYVRSGLNKIKDLDMDFVCNSHGPILTRDGILNKVIAQYTAWANPEPRQNKHIPLFYCTAYGNTQQLIEATKKGVEKVLPDAQVAAYNLNDHNMADMIALMNGSDGFVLGSPTINRDAVPPIWQLLTGMDAIAMQKRPVAVLGSFGWSGEALPHMAERLASVKAKVFQEQLKVAFVPTQQDLDAAEALGQAFAKEVAGI